MREDIDERLSGRLPAGRNAAVEAHLERCPACRAEVELAAAIRRELSALPRFDAPPRVIEAIRRRVGAAPAGATLKFSRNANRRLPARVALAAAAAVALAVAMVVSLPDRSPQPSRMTAAEVDLATAEARFAFALIADATTSAQRELRDGVLRDRVLATAARGLSRSFRLDGHSGDIRSRNPTPITILGGPS